MTDWIMVAEDAQGFRISWTACIFVDQGISVMPRLVRAQQSKFQ